MRHALDFLVRSLLLAPALLPVASGQSAAQSNPLAVPRDDSSTPPAAVFTDGRVAPALDLQLPLAERVAALESLLVEPRDAAREPTLVPALAKAFAERGRREAVALLDRLLLDPATTPSSRRFVLEVAAQLPDPQLAATLFVLLDREAELGGPVDASLASALRAVHEATRRRWLDLEEAQLLRAAPEALVAALDHPEALLRRVTLGRLIEFAQRNEPVPREVFERVSGWLANRLPALLARDATASNQEELRRVAELAVLLDPGSGVGERLTAEFVAQSSEARRTALLPALRRLPPQRGGGDAASAIAATLLDSRTPQSSIGYLEVVLDALRALADARALPAIEACMAPPFAPAAWGRAFAAASELARRDASPETTRRVIDRLAPALVDAESDEVRFAAALGLSQLLEAVAARLGPDSAGATVDQENLGQIFDAMRRALPSTITSRVLAEPCCRALCRVPGRAQTAAQVISDVLLAAPESAPVREVLIDGLKELRDPAGLPAIIGALPRGGPSVEPTAVGKAAYAALLAVLRSAPEGVARLAVELAAVEQCLARGEAAWGYYLAAPLLGDLETYDEAEPQHAIRFAYARAVLGLRDPSKYESGFEQCEWVVLQALVGAPRGIEARWLLLELAEAIFTEHSADAALYAEELLPTLATAPERAALSLRVARLLFADGDWEAAYRWLDGGADEATMPLDALLLKTRAATRRGDVNAPRDATRLHELLLGKGGLGGGALAEDAPERTALEVQLVELLLDGGREREAALLFARLPSAEVLPTDLGSTCRRLEARMKSLGGG